MNASPIRVLKPHVSREEALRVFSSRGFSAIYWRISSGPLQRIADAFVPFRLYRVRYGIAGTTRTRLFALDAVSGTLDLFEFPRIPGEDELLETRTRNRLTASLGQEHACELLRDKALRVIFQEGFFKLRELNLEIEQLPMELHLPYWLAFYGSRGAVRCRVLDAVRRRIEGGKASAFFEQWLAT